MADTTTKHPFVGHDYTVHTAFPWTHGRCIAVRLGKNHGRVTSVRLLFPDGNERWFTTAQVLKVVVY